MPPAKKRQKTAAVEEIKFDFAAREEYLTGFHKRKLARIKHAQEEAAKREKEDKLRMRRELRQQRKEELEKHVAEVNMLLRQANGEPSEDEETEGATSGEEGEEEWEGFVQEKEEPIDREEEYIDEDKYTTVTVETVGIDKHGFSRVGDASEDEEREEGNEGNGGKTEADGEGKGKKRLWTKERPKGDKVKKKKRKFRYESKAERKVTRAKEGLKNSAQARARRG